MVEKLPYQEIDNNDIELIFADTRAFVTPDGAYLKAFEIGGREILFSTREMEINNEKKVRGGSPLLFPAGGPQEGGMSQHGFARDLKWVEETTNNDQLFNPRTLLRLQDTPETRKVFPYLFELDLSIELGKNSLFYKLGVLNKGEEPMPIAPGFHPYFNVPQKEKFGQIKTNIKGLDLGKYGESQLTKSLFFPLNDLEVIMPDSSKIKVEYGGSFKREQATFVVWTDNKNYICFEPWAAGVGALYDKKQQLLVPPGKRTTFSMLLSVS